MRGTGSHCAVVLPSPALVEVFRSERTEELWHSQEQKPRGAQDRRPAGESPWLSETPCKSASLGREASWQCCLAGAEHNPGIANPASGCSDGSHRAN